MASLIVAGDAAVGDVGTGKKFCAGMLYNATGTASGGGSAYPPMELLVVGGGGGGGNNDDTRGSGGGAGGLIYIEEYRPAPGEYAIVIGAGGAEGLNGVDTTFGDGIVAKGGGHGGYADNTNNGGIGGSGGGQWYPGYTGAASNQPIYSVDLDNMAVYINTGFGNKGGTSGPAEPYGSGGGGAGAPGANFDAVGGGVGGIGKQYSISGTATYYAGGGGSGDYSIGGKYAGGLGGGGRGWNGGTEVEQNGVANTGGGGGAGGSGGSGIVVVRYATADFGNCTGGTETTDGDYTVHTFTESGTFTVVAA